MTQLPPIGVFLVDDHPLMRAATTDYLDVTPNLRVCGEAASAEDAMASVEEARPDVILVDLSLPRIGGIELVTALRERGITIPCIVLSGHGDIDQVERALAAGARGYVLKGDPRELPDAIQQVLDGDVYVSEPLRNALGRTPPAI